MHRAPMIALSVLPLLPLAACGGDDAPQVQPAASGVTAPTGSPSASSAGSSAGSSTSADLMDGEGAQVGTVTLTFDGGTTTVEVQATDLAPGLHGFHLHKTGFCEVDSPDPTDPTKTGDFLSAGGHLAEQGQSHGDHSGDLPSLLVAEDGTATMTFTTDRVAEDDVLDDDGTAVMVHADRDNFANVPERYAPQGPDETTTKTGDAGGRVACAALTAEG